MINYALLAFGPVPSRRLGHSLGINNIPPKVCSYSCIYCQLGRTLNMRAKREVFYKPEEIEKIANFIAGLKDVKSYIAIPTKPPAEKWVKSANEHTINTAYQLFKEKAINVEYLIGYEGNAFAFTGNIEEDLLSITSVHPMRKEAVDEFLKKANGNWDTIEKLITENRLIEAEYKNNKFYVRKLNENS